VSIDVLAMKISRRNLLAAGGSTAIMGHASGTSKDSEDTLRFSQRNQVTSTNEIYPLDQAQTAYERMMSGKARFRVVLKVGD